MGRLSRTLAAFVGGSILAYVLVVVGAFTFLSFMLTRDLTKKIAATVFFIVGPAVALIGGVWLAVWQPRVGRRGQ